MFGRSAFCVSTANVSDGHSRVLKMTVLNSRSVKEDIRGFECMVFCGRGGAAVKQLRRSEQARMVTGITDCILLHPADA